MRKLTFPLFMMMTLNAHASNPKDQVEDILPQGMTSKFTSGYRFHAVNFVTKPVQPEKAEPTFKMKNSFYTGFHENEVQKKSLALGSKQTKKVPAKSVKNPINPDTKSAPRKKPCILDVDKTSPEYQMNQKVVKLPAKTPSRRKKPSILDVDMELPRVQEATQVKRTLDPSAPENDPKRTKVEEPLIKVRHKLTMADILNPDLSDEPL